MAEAARKTPSIPSIPENLSPDLRRFLSAIKEAFEVREGIRHGQSDAERSALMRDLAALTLEESAAADTGAGTPGTTTDTTAPGSPTGCLLRKSLIVNVLVWAWPDDADVSYVQVRYNTVNDLAASDLIAIITSPVARYYHTPEDSTAEHFYWIRVADFAGNFSSWVMASVDESAPGLVGGLSATLGTWGYVFAWDNIPSDYLRGYNLYLDGALVNAEYKGTNFNWVSSLAQGSHTFTVKAVDIYGREEPAGSSVIFVQGDNRGVTKIRHTLSKEGLLTLSWKPVEGTGDPQVLYYQVTGARDAAIKDWSLATDIIGQAQNIVTAEGLIRWEGRISYEIVTIFVRAKLKINGNEGWSNNWLILELQTLSSTSITISVAEPNYVASWKSVAKADFYEVIQTKNGWSGREWVYGNSAQYGLSRYGSTVMVRAWDDEGYFSAWVKEEINVTGAYTYNEVVNIPVDFVNGRYLNFAWSAANKVVRPSIMGIAISLPVVNVNDSDLFNFAASFENTSAASLEGVPADWFRDGWWMPEDGYFESASHDFGSLYSGIIICRMIKSVVSHSKTAEAMANAPAMALAPLTADQITSDDALLTADLFVSADNLNWKMVKDGDWVSDIRHVRVKGSVLYASPLDEITITQTTLSIDVPDMTETGTRVVTGGTAAITFTKPFRVCTFVMCNCQGNFVAWSTSITKNGFTLNVSTTSTQTVFWFAKGY